MNENISNLHRILILGLSFMNSACLPPCKVIKTLQVQTDMESSK